MAEMYPETRGRTATESTASRRPVNSSHSVTSRETTSATVIFGGGGVSAGCATAREQAVTNASDVRKMSDAIVFLRLLFMPHSIGSGAAANNRAVVLARSTTLGRCRDRRGGA